MSYRVPTTSQGYAYFGPIQIPASPQPIILTDLDDGKQWMISWNATLPEHITINDDLSLMRRSGARVYAAGEGPKFGNEGEYTLILRGTHLGLLYEPFQPWQSDADTAPVYARITTNFRENRELVLVEETLPSTVHIAWDSPNE